MPHGAPAIGALRPHCEAARPARVVLVVTGLTGALANSRFFGVHSRVGAGRGYGYAAPAWFGVATGSHGRPAWAPVMAFRKVRPWSRADVRYELIKHHRSRLWSVCQYPRTA